MKKVFQNFKSGKIELLDVPNPEISDNEILIESSLSLISFGTEKMLIDFAKSNLLNKAIKQPHRVRQVLDKVQSDGVLSTYKTVRSKLDQLMPMGYSNCGKVIKVGKNVNGFQPGDRVVSNGSHAEVVNVSKNLCCKIPSNVTDESAVFTVIGSIAMQGIRLVKPSFGESAVVIGLGLIGILTSQILIANGCRVVGVETNPERIKIAKNLGIKCVNQKKNLSEDKEIKNLAAGNGIDAVIICTNTDSNEPIHQAANISRKNGRIVLIGTTGMNVSRDAFYEKEITFQVSCSYGPGRYDSKYEIEGNDYPIGYVRWTEQRNFEAVLNAISDNKIQVEELITQKFYIDNIKNAYENLSDSKNSMAIILEYKNKNKKKSKPDQTRIKITSNNELLSNNNISLAIIGAGNYVSQTLAPEFSKTGAKLIEISSKEGINAAKVARKYGFQQASSNFVEIFKNKKINTVVIANTHNMHAELIVRSLKSKKNIFVEKPLCINLKELNQISKNYKETLAKKQNSILMVGFNRRFSPLTTKVKELLENCGPPYSFSYNVNAGYIDPEHWTQNKKIGGGRIIGEICHFIDFLNYLANSQVETHKAFVMTSSQNDTISIILKYKNGSIGSINYFSNGNKRFPKENLEIFTSGKILKLNNFKSLEGYGWKNFTSKKLWNQDKGQAACIKKFAESIKNKEASPIGFEEIEHATRISIEIEENLNEV